MFDNQIFQLLRGVIIANVTAFGLPSNLAVKKAYQPTRQGVNTAPTLYIFKVSDRPLGSQKQSDTWDPVGLKSVHVEMQQYETSFQLQALVKQDPTQINQLTASDVVKRARAILQHSTTIASLQANGVGLYRPGLAVSNPYFEDDSERFEADPSFDFTVTHKDTITTTGPGANPVIFQILPV